MAKEKESRKGIDLLTMLLHDRQELDNDLGRGTDENLSLSTLLSVVDVVQTILQNGDSDHYKILQKGGRGRGMSKQFKLSMSVAPIAIHKSGC